MLLQGNAVASKTAQSATTAKRSQPETLRAALVPKMTLTDFCETFSLSVFILQKLDVMKITGPHGLRFVSNQQLVEVGGMDIGELADVRDAQERWGYGYGKDEAVF